MQTFTQEFDRLCDKQRVKEIECCVKVRNIPQRVRLANMGGNSSGHRTSARNSRTMAYLYREVRP